MSQEATPVVEDADDKELADLNAQLDAMAWKGQPAVEQATDEEPAADEAPEASAEDTEPTADTSADTTDRRSRREGKKEPQPQKVNLTDLPEFREWQSTRDREAEQMRRQLAQLQAEREQAAQAAEAAQLAHLNQQFANLDPDDVDARQKLIDQLAEIKAQGRFRQYQQQSTQAQQWAEYVHKTVADAGLDPKDFPPEKYHFQGGDAAFGRDLATAALKEMRKLKEAASPQAIQKQAATVAAKTLRAQGLDVADATTPGKGVTDAEARQERDMQLVQMGRMSGAEYLRRWGDK